MLPQEIIRTKRDGKRLTVDEIDQFVAGITSGAVADAQAGAFAMAVFLRGMDTDECVALTRAMTASGTQLQWSLDGPVVDKHSTGGVGDTVSLMLGPMVAASATPADALSGLIDLYVEGSFAERALTYVYYAEFGNVAAEDRVTLQHIQQPCYE